MFRQRHFISVIITIIGFTLITSFYLNTFTNYYHTNSLNDRILSSKIDHLLMSTRILCLIVTSTNSFSKSAIAVNDTWASRCDRYIFITDLPSNSKDSLLSSAIKDLPIVPIQNMASTYAHRTQKSILAFLFAYENYLDDFDWFVKVDDNTCLLVENLKVFLNKQNSNDPIAFMLNSQIDVKKMYHSSVISYVLSRESLRRFYQAQQDPNTDYGNNKDAEDVKVTKCLRSKDVSLTTSLDEQNSKLYYPHCFADHFGSLYPSWFPKLIQNPQRTDYNYCNDQIVSFHYLQPEQQYFIHFLLYKMRS